MYPKVCFCSHQCHSGKQKTIRLHTIQKLTKILEEAHNTFSLITGSDTTKFTALKMKCSDGLLPEAHPCVDMTGKLIVQSLVFSHYMIDSGYNEFFSHDYRTEELQGSNLASSQQRQHESHCLSNITACSNHVIRGEDTSPYQGNNPEIPGHIESTITGQYLAHAILMDAEVLGTPLTSPQNMRTWRELKPLPPVHFLTEKQVELESLYGLPIGRIHSGEAKMINLVLFTPLAQSGTWYSSPDEREWAKDFAIEGTPLFLLLSNICMHIQDGNEKLYNDLTHNRPCVMAEAAFKVSNSCIRKTSQDAEWATMIQLHFGFDRIVWALLCMMRGSLVDPVQRPFMPYPAVENRAKWMIEKLADWPGIVHNFVNKRRDFDHFYVDEERGRDRTINSTRSLLAALHDVSGCPHLTHVHTCFILASLALRALCIVSTMCYQNGAHIHNTI